MGEGEVSKKVQFLSGMRNMIWPAADGVTDGMINVACSSNFAARSLCPSPCPASPLRVVRFASSGTNHVRVLFAKCPV
jgi:hypothetical protein